MAIADDISVAANGDIRRTGDAHGGASPNYYTTIELYRFLQDLADDAVASGDDLIDITSLNPARRVTDNYIILLNGYNIDDDLAEYIYNGTIEQDGGDTFYDGFVNFGNAANIMIHQNGSVLTNEYWNETAHKAATSDSGSGISSRFLLKTRTGGADINGRRVLGLSREFGNTYAEFPVNGTSRGNNVLALSEANDNFNNTASGTVATWTDIVNTEGYQSIDLNNGNGSRPYYSEWDRGSRGINDLFERSKYLTRKGSSETVYGLNGQLFRGITHDITVDTPTGTFSAVEPVSWSGGTGQMLAIDSTTAGTQMWIQLLTGIAPTDGQTITGGTSGATVDVNVTVTERTVPVPFIGASTGSALLGAYGVGVEAVDLTNADSLIDLTNTPQQPPNLQSFVVAGIVSGEDRVLVGPNDGSDEVDFNQLSVNGAQSAGSGTLIVNETIPSDTPASGTVRVFSGTSYDRVPYASFSGSTFTLTGTLPNSVSDAANAWISYIDELASGTTASYSALYSSDRSLVVKVRSGSIQGSEIQEFKSPATFGVAGGAVSAIRTADV